MKIRPVGAELFHDRQTRQTDMANIIVAFSIFVNAPKHRYLISLTADGGLDQWGLT